MPSAIAKRLIAEIRSIHMPDYEYVDSDTREKTRRCQACSEEWPCMAERLCRELERV